MVFVDRNVELGRLVEAEELQTRRVDFGDQVLIDAVVADIEEADVATGLEDRLGDPLLSRNGPMSITGMAEASISLCAA